MAFYLKLNTMTTNVLQLYLVAEFKNEITMEELYGCFNKSADLVKRKNETWSDTNLTNEFKGDEEFTRLECRNCKGITFEVLQTGSYETSARCCDCGMYYLAHCG